MPNETLKTLSAVSVVNKVVADSCRDYLSRAVKSSSAYKLLENVRFVCKCQASFKKKE